MNNNNTMYTSVIPMEHGPCSLNYDACYHPHSSNPNVYNDFHSVQKLDAPDYNYWQNNSFRDTLSSSNQTTDTCISILANNNLPTQNYCSSSSSSSPTCNDSLTWISRTDYPQLNSTPYRHYSTPCSFYTPTNIYEHSQWVPSATYPIKFQPSYGSASLHYESSDVMHQCNEQLPNEETKTSSEPSQWLKSQISPSTQNVFPPRNPLNGKTRTRDKYRIVYTDQQRSELENEFSVSKYISIPRKSALSLSLALSERQIKIWFQNRRAKERKMNKRRHERSDIHKINKSNDLDSDSDDEFDSPRYSQIYT